MVATVLDTVFTAAHRSLWSEATWAEHGWPLAPMANLGCALMGALIVSRHPRHPLGWLLCVASLLAVTLAAEAYGVWVLDGGGPGRETHGATWRSGRDRCSAGRPSPRWCWSSSSHRTATCPRPAGAGRSGSRWPGSMLHTLGTLTHPARATSSTASETAPARITAALLTVGLDAGRGRAGRLGSLPGGAAAALARRRTPPAAVDRLGGRDAGCRRGGDPGCAADHRSRGDVAGGLPLRVAQVAGSALRGGRGAAPPVARDRHDRQPRLAVALATALVAVGYVLVVVTVGLVGGRDHRLLALAARNSRRGAGLPAPAQPGGPDGRPAGVRHRGRTVRSSRRLQPAPRQQPRPHRPAAGCGRGRRRGRSRARRASVVLHVDAGLDLTASWPVRRRRRPRGARGWRYRSCTWRASRHHHGRPCRPVSHCAARASASSQTWPTKPDWPSATRG